MMNFDELGKMTGWLPGAAGGTIVGLVGAYFYWEEEAAGVCGETPTVGSFSIAQDCIQTFAGDFTDPKAFAVACLAVGGIVGAIANFVQSQLSPGT